MIVGYFSHELRNPLNAVMAGLQVLRRNSSQGDEPDAFITDLLNDVESSCMVATDILEDLVMYERLESGEVSLNKSFFQIIP